MAKNIKISPARVSAYKVLSDVLFKNAYSNISLNKHLAGVKIESDRKLCTNIVNGVLKKINMLEFVLSQLSNIELKDIDEKVRLSIYMGLYQILYLNKIPEYALVNDSVNLVKLFVNKKASGFVNGVLRNALRKKNEFKHVEFEDYYSKLYYEYGFNRALIKKLLLSYDKEEILEYAKFVNEPAKVTLRVNRLKASRQDVIDKLTSQDFLVKEAFTEDGIEVLSHLNVTLLDEFKQGLFSIQDNAGMMVAYALDPKPGMNVLDMCSAPGGKSFHVAEIMGNEGSITSCDVYKKKLELMEFRKQQLGINILKTKKMDGTKYNEAYVEKFDRVICDVPCSGLGVVRRKPEILINYSDEKIKNLTVVQEQILENGIKYLKKGGELVYSTCTINKEENEDIIKKVVSKHEDLEFAPIVLSFDFQYDKEMAKKGILNVRGEKNDCDGFFVSKIVKKA